MKIKQKPYDPNRALTSSPHKKPLRQSFFFRLLLRVVSSPALWAVKFRFKKINMERIGKKEPCLYLMNHSCFLDMEIASVVLFPKRFHVVSTYDGFVGKSLLMRLIGCIPTRKFILDLPLLHDMKYAVEKLKGSILLYPEAGYSFDGTSTTLPDTLGACVKMLGIPLVMIETHGAFLRQPLYNGLKLRKVPVSAEMRCLLTAEEVANTDADEINKIIAKSFSFDAFRWQQENRLRIDEADRADFLERVLYKCPACKTEGRMKGRGTKITCHACQKQYELDEYGYLRALDGVTEFSHIPDWYRWEREEVKRELENGTYRLDCAVEILLQTDTKCIYRAGDGRLTHDKNGFVLKSDNGSIEFIQKPLASYSLNSDFYWYELGDMIGLGNQSVLYYCIPKDPLVSVAKARLAAEELYQIVKAEKRKKRNS